MKDVIHMHFAPEEIINDYNNGRGPFVKRSMIEWCLILGYLHAEYKIYSGLDEKNGTDLALGVDTAINDVRRFMREQCTEPTVVCFAPDKAEMAGHA